MGSAERPLPFQTATKSSFNAFNTNEIYTLAAAAAAVTVGKQQAYMHPPTSNTHCSASPAMLRGTQLQHLEALRRQQPVSLTLA
jgi:hypothetical protein